MIACPFFFDTCNVDTLTIGKFTKKCNCLPKAKKKISFSFSFQRRKKQRHSAVPKTKFHWSFLCLWFSYNSVLVEARQNVPLTHPILHGWIGYQFRSGAFELRKLHEEEQIINRIPKPHDQEIRKAWTKKLHTVALVLRAVEQISTSSDIEGTLSKPEFMMIKLALFQEFKSQERNGEVSFRDLFAKARQSLSLVHFPNTQARLNISCISLKDEEKENQGCFCWHFWEDRSQPQNGGSIFRSTLSWWKWYLFVCISLYGYFRRKNHLNNCWNMWFKHVSCKNSCSIFSGRKFLKLEIIVMWCWRNVPSIANILSSWRT